MTPRRPGAAHDDGPRTVVVTHPGAELFGSDRMALESVRALSEEGLRVVVALPERGPLVPALMHAGAEVVIVPMLVLRKSLMRPRGWGKLVRDAARGFRASWRLLRRQSPVALYVSTVTIPLWPIVGRLLGIPTITHVHEAESSASGVVKRVLYAPHLLSTRVIVNSDFSRRTMAEVFPSLASRARVVYNGVEAPTSPPAPRAVIDSEIHILYMGRLSPRKGVADVLTAARALHREGIGVTVTVLGSVFAGYEWFEAELHAAAGRSDSPSVTFLGFRPDIWNIVAESDIVIVPSQVDEPFGNTAVEGILARRPIIASDTSGLREAAGGYATALLVPPCKPAAIASAVEEIAQRWDEMRLAVDSSAARARSRHSPDSYRTRLREVVGDATEPQG